MSEFHVSFPGPFSQHEVVVDGWKVPLVHAQMNQDDDSRVTLILDNRFGETFTVEEAERFVPFLAHCMAVALGFTCHPNEDDEMPLTKQPHPRPVRMHGILGISTDTDAP